jgi:hypothetical protein
VLPTVRPCHPEKVVRPAGRGAGASSRPAGVGRRDDPALGRGSGRCC